MAGAVFENYIITEMAKYHDLANLYFYRTSDKLEVDLIIDHGYHKHCIEIKKPHHLSHPTLSMLLTTKIILSSSMSN